MVTATRKLTRFDSDGALLRAGFYDWIGIESYGTWLYSNGAAFFNDEQTRATFNNDRGRETLSFQLELWNTTQAYFGICG